MSRSPERSEGDEAISEVGGEIASLRSNRAYRAEISIRVGCPTSGNLPLLEILRFAQNDKRRRAQNGRGMDYPIKISKSIKEI